MKPNMKIVIEGAGEVKVMITLKSSAEKVLDKARHAGLDISAGEAAAELDGDPPAVGQNDGGASGAPHPR